MSWQFSSPVSNHKWLFSRAEGTLQDSVGQQQQRADFTWNFFVVERIEKEWEKEKSENASTKARSTHHCAVQSSFFSSSSSANDSNFGRERVALLLPFSCCVIALSVPLVFLSSSSTGAGKTRNRSQSCFFFFLLFRIPPPKSLPIWILMALLLFSIIYLPPPPPLWICCALYARPESIISNQINNEAHGSDRVISWTRPVGTTDSSRPKKKVART